MSAFDRPTGRSGGVWCALGLLLLSASGDAWSAPITYKFNWTTAASYVDVVTTQEESLTLTLSGNPLDVEQTPSGNYFYEGPPTGLVGELSAFGQTASVGSFYLRTDHSIGFKGSPYGAISLLNSSATGDAFLSVFNSHALYPDLATYDLRSPVGPIADAGIPSVLSGFANVGLGDGVFQGVTSIGDPKSVSFAATAPAPGEIKYRFDWTATVTRTTRIDLPSQSITLTLVGDTDTVRQSPSGNYSNDPGSSALTGFLSANGRQVATDYFALHTIHRIGFPDDDYAGVELLNSGLNPILTMLAPHKSYPDLAVYDLSSSIGPIPDANRIAQAFPDLGVDLAAFLFPGVGGQVSIPDGVVSLSFESSTGSRLVPEPGVIPLLVLALGIPLLVRGVGSRGSRGPGLLS